MKSKIILLAAAMSCVTLPTKANPLKPKQIIQMPSPNYDVRPPGTSITTIVIHDTEDVNTKRVLRLFCSRNFGRCPHFTIDKAGRIYQHFSVERMGSHAGRSFFKGRGRVNEFSIGIELINLGDGKDPFTEAQYKSLTSLLTWLSSTYHIRVDHIVGHKDIAIPRGRKADPASNFAFSRIRRALSVPLKIFNFQSATLLQ